MPSHAGEQHEDEVAWRMTGSAAEIADVLAEFATELRGGDVNVWKGQRSLHLHPDNRIELRVDAVVHEGRQGLHIELHWG
jgi:amphi-Trp domain-containing protein